MSFASVIKRRIAQRKLKNIKGQPLFTPKMNLSGSGFGFMPTNNQLMGGTISHRPTVGRALDALENLSISAKKPNAKYKPLKFNF
jgi:hypothetical protein